jgi:hypothetical protein
MFELNNLELKRRIVQEHLQAGQLVIDYGSVGSMYHSLIPSDSFVKVDNRPEVESSSLGIFVLANVLEDFTDKIPNGKFDVALCFDTFQFLGSPAYGNQLLPIPHGLAISNMMNPLKVGGKLLVLTPVSDSEDFVHGLAGPHYELPFLTIAATMRGHLVDTVIYEYADARQGILRSVPVEFDLDDQPGSAVYLLFILEKTEEQELIFPDLEVTDGWDIDDASGDELRSLVGPDWDRDDAWVNQSMDILEKMSPN